MLYCATMLHCKIYENVLLCWTEVSDTLFLPFVDIVVILAYVQNLLKFIIMKLYFV